MTNLDLITARDVVFIDTWGWLAHGNKSDGDHRQVAAAFARLRSLGCRLETSDYVLDELINLLFRRVRSDLAMQFMAKLFKSIAQGGLTLRRVTPERFARAWELRIKYQDKPLISFTDLTSMAIMEELKTKHILTRDQHFTHVGMDIDLLLRF